MNIMMKKTMKKEKIININKMNKKFRNNCKKKKRNQNKLKSNKLKKMQMRPINKKTKQLKKIYSILRHMSIMMKKMIKNEQIIYAHLI